MADFALQESSELISHKIWVVTKSWNFHTVFNDSTVPFLKPWNFSLFSDHIRCNFQDDFCDWICKPLEGNFSFQRGTPATLNDSNRPQIQSSTKVQDTFAFIRPSSPKNVGRIAEIHSQSPVSEDGCMTFWFDFQVRLLFFVHGPKK